MIPQSGTGFAGADQLGQCKPCLALLLGEIGNQALCEEKVQGKHFFKGKALLLYALAHLLGAGVEKEIRAYIVNALFQYVFFR